jgi:hypothetical protein
MSLEDRSTADPYAGRDRPARLLAAVVAATFLVVGVLGFVPGVTTDYDQLSFAEHHSEARLLGVFQVSVLHNVVHLLFGAIGLLMARTAAGATTYLVGGGLVYAVLFVYGVSIDQDSAATVVPVNTADNYLHLGLALGMVVLGLVGRTLWRGNAWSVR